MRGISHFQPAGYCAHREENYWEKLSRISREPKSRLYCTDHKSRHVTTYNIVVFNAQDPFLRIRCETLCAMEVLNQDNPACFTCEPKGKLRGLLHKRE